MRGSLSNGSRLFIMAVFVQLQGVLGDNMGLLVFILLFFVLLFFILLFFVILK